MRQKSDYWCVSRAPWHMCTQTLCVNADTTSGIAVEIFLSHSSMLSFQISSLLTQISVIASHRMGQTIFYLQILDTSMVFVVTCTSLYLDLD